MIEKENIPISEETKKKLKGKICPCWVEETIEEISRPGQRKVKVYHCLATGRNVCSRDYTKYELCEFYQKYKKETPGPGKVRFKMIKPGG